MDYSKFDRPLTPLFQTDQPDQTFQLSDSQLDLFQEQGYIADIPVFTEQQCDQLCSELSELVDPQHAGSEFWYEYHSNESADPQQVLFHALGAWRVRPGFHDCLFNHRMLVPASQLLGGDVRFWHDQLFCKPAKHGGVVAWHQDYSYWTRTAPMAHLTCWIGLDPATPDNGCLQYIPGSHHWDLLPITGLAGDMNAIEKVLTPQQWEQFQNPVAIPLKRGYASFHHPLLVHGSFANQTETPRRAVVINLVRDGVCSQSNDPLLKGVSPVPTGQPLGGQFFPLLYQN